MVPAVRAPAVALAAQPMSTSAGQEDHAPRGWTAALRTRRSVRDLRRVVAIEFVCAAQALDLRESLPSDAPMHAGPGTGALRDSLRDRIDHLDHDRFLAPDLVAAERWLASPTWRVAAEAAVGALR